jgi:hypothetical protein
MPPSAEADYSLLHSGRLSDVSEDLGAVAVDCCVVTSQTTALANERNAIDILRRHLEANVLLIKAMGDGWTSRACLSYEEAISIGTVVSE